MIMADLFFECLVEELPALSVEPAAAFMAEYMAQNLAAKQLTHGAIKTFGTPRRLVVAVENLASKQADVTEEVLGPKVEIAFLPDGKLAQAGLGFLTSKGLSASEAYKKVTQKGEVIAAKLSTPGRLASQILEELLPDMLRKIPFKKRMRWEQSGDTFARPVRSMVALFGDQYLKVNFADVVSGETSSGHRFMAPEVFKVTSLKQYQDEMKKRFVVLAAEERRDLIINDAHARLQKIGGVFKGDEELLKIVPNLVEYPFVIVGSFESSYLEVPPEILVSEMATHQKCFAVYNAQGGLLPNFVTVAGTKPHSEEVFASGNARVLRARFADGAFYFASDKGKGLKEMAASLSSLVFERDLGDMAQKTERISLTAQQLAKYFTLTPLEKKTLQEAAPLIKADLVSGVVGEFPELQGIMGRTYANLAGMDASVGEAIETHYWPKFAGDLLPPHNVGAILALADRLDTLVGIIGQGQGPKGNKDPFGLRRAAIALVRLVLEFSLRLPVSELVAAAIQSYPKNLQAKWNNVVPECADFIMQRARGLLVEQLSASQAVDAVKFVDGVLAVGMDDLVDIFARAEVLFAMQQQNPAELESLSQTFKRAGNIVKKAEAGGWKGEEVLSGDLLTTSSEQALLLSVKETQKLVSSQNSLRAHTVELKEFYKKVFDGVSVIKPKLDKFFEENMVMVDDISVRNSRLNLLDQIKSLSESIADFTHI
jgi:glycyl-tRNA synthetase beta chain